MFKLSSDQYADIRARDKEHFVQSICDQFMESRPEKAALPGRVAVCRSMQRTFDFAINAGFTSTPHLIRLMYMAGDIPGIHEDQTIRAYLLRPGATPEQRLDDLVAAVDHKLKGIE